MSVGVIYMFKQVSKPYSTGQTGLRMLGKHCWIWSCPHFDMYSFDMSSCELFGCTIWLRMGGVGQCCVLNHMAEEEERVFESVEL